MLGAQPKKLAALEAIGGGRVIFVGGSGLGQGMLTPIVQERLGRPCYNLGLHAGLGLIYQLRSVRHFLRSGDVVVIVPEYANFSGTFAYGQTELVSLLVDVLPQHRSLLGIWHWGYLLPNVLEHGAGKLRRVVARFLPDGSSKGFDHSGEYDKHGDKVWDDEPVDIHYNIGAAKVMVGGDFASTVLPSMCWFKQNADALGVRVIVMPPAFNCSSYSNQIPFICEVSEQLRNIGMGFAAEPSRYALDDKYFHDTAYHLNMTGRRLRARLMADDLEKILSKECSRDISK